jgi:uncharacterized surface protein with fasciclin (FAS1) repeats
MNRRQFFSATAGAAAASLATPAILSAQSATIVDLAVATPELSTLVTAVQAAGLVDTLSGPGNFTVFAPTNRAFEHLPHGILQGLLHDIPALTNVLTYHVSAAYYPASAIIGQRGRIPTVQGGYISANGQGHGVVLNHSATVTTADVMASNGVVHIIDAVLLPG